MGIRFPDLVVAGVILLREAIRSPNYIAGVSGWSINQDGSSEFNDIDIRGEFETIGSLVRTAINSGGIFQSVRPAGVNATATIFSMYPKNPTDLGVAIDLPATIAAVLDTSTGERPILQISSPSFAAKVRATMFLTGQTTGSGVDNSQIFLIASNVSASADMFVGDDLTVTGDTGITGNLQVSGTGNIDGTLRLGPNDQEIGQGVIAGAHSLAVSAAIGAAETVVLTSAVATWRAGHTYCVTVYGEATTSVVGLANNPLFRVRKTNVAGQQLGFRRVYCPVVAATGFPADFRILFDVGAADVSSAICLTLQGGGAYNAIHQGGGANGRGFYITDIGSAANPALDSANVVTLV